MRTPELETLEERIVSEVNVEPACLFVLRIRRAWTSRLDVEPSRSFGLNGGLCPSHHQSAKACFSILAVHRDYINLNRLGIVAKKRGEAENARIERYDSCSILTP